MHKACSSSARPAGRLTRRGVAAAGGPHRFPGSRIRRSPAERAPAGEARADYEGRSSVQTASPSSSAMGYGRRTGEALQEPRLFGLPEAIARGMRQIPKRSAGPASDLLAGLAPPGLQRSALRLGVEPPPDRPGGRPGRAPRLRALQRREDQRAQLLARLGAVQRLAAVPLGGDDQRALAGPAPAGEPPQPRLDLRREAAASARPRSAARPRSRPC